MPTPSGAAESAWDEPADIKGDAKGVSDLLIIDGNICAVKGNRIVLIDSETGKKELASCSIGANIGYFCRPAYKDGYLVVPFEDGSLGIFVLDKKDGQYSIACRYKTPSLGIKDTQALTSVTISDGKAYAGFTVVDGSEGALVCVDLASGKVDWTTDKRSPRPTRTRATTGRALRPPVTTSSSVTSPVRLPSLMAPTAKSSRA